MRASKFTKEDNVVEFSSNSCIVEDKDTRISLFQGVNKGINQLSIPSASHFCMPSAYFPNHFAHIKEKVIAEELFSGKNIPLYGNKTDFITWHRRLGHPCMQNVSNVLKIFKLSYF